MSCLAQRVRGLFLSSLILVLSGLVRAGAQLPTVSLTLAPGVPYEKVFGHYVLYGGVGAQRGSLKKTRSRAVQSPAVGEGKPVKPIKKYNRAAPRTMTDL